MSEKNGKIRTTWLSMLQDELDLMSMADIKEPDVDPRDNETVLGRAPDNDCKLWALSEKLEELSTRTLVDARYSRATEQEALVNRAFEMDTKAKLARDMLWANLKDEYQLWNPHYYIGLRKGFVVVSGRKDSL